MDQTQSYRREVQPAPTLASQFQIEPDHLDETYKPLPPDNLLAEQSIHMSKNRTRAQKEFEATRALELHSQGMSTRAIAEKMTNEGMPISQPTVVRRIQYALESYVIPARAEAKAQELARIDAVLEAQSAKLADGDSKAADLVLKAVALRSKLLGLDAPQQQAEAPAPAITGLLEQARLRAVK